MSSGTSSSTRKVDIWAQDGMTMRGNLVLNNRLKLNAAGGEYWSIYPQSSDLGDKNLFFEFSGNSSNWVSGWLEPFSGG